MNQQLNLTDTLERSTALVPVAKDPTGAERQKRHREKQKQQPKPEPEAAHEFDWFSEADRDAVVVAEQQPIAIYENGKNCIVIRQGGGMCDPDDHYILIHADNLQAVIDRLCDLAGIGGVP